MKGLYSKWNECFLSGPKCNSKWEMDLHGKAIAKCFWGGRVTIFYAVLEGGRMEMCKTPAEWK